MKKKKIFRATLLIALCAALSGCRIRTTGGGTGGETGETGGETAESQWVSGTRPGEGTGEADREAEPEKPEKPEKPQKPEKPEKPEEPEKTEKTEKPEKPEKPEEDGEPGGRTRENPEATRKEYDENAPAEIVAGTDRTVQTEGEGDGAYPEGENAEKTAAKLKDDAEETATRTVAAEEAEKKGVDEDAKEADSAMTYYTVLLQDRMGGLFECQRMNVYWETAEDHVTIHKTSTEHRLILGAGAYDVSARLLEENLRVDDGWIGRKNPGVIVKTVGNDILGSGVVSTGAARRERNALLAREGWNTMDAARNGRVLLLSEELLETPHLQTAAMLAIAKTANPEGMADVDIGKAIGMLAEEATGSAPEGIFCYSGAEGF